MDVMKIDNIKKLILEIRGKRVIIDKDVAEIYGVETKRVNEAVKNNPNKFPDDYFFQVTGDEYEFCGRNFRPQNRRMQQHASLFYNDQLPTL